MNEGVFVVASVVAGIGIGAVYTYTLWLTVQRLPDATNPAMLFLLSFVGRMAFVLLGFYLVMGGSWVRLLACLVGFTAARLLLTRRLGVDSASRRTIEEINGRQ